MNRSLVLKCSEGHVPGGARRPSLCVLAWNTLNEAVSDRGCLMGKASASAM